MTRSGLNDAIWWTFELLFLGALKGKRKKYSTERKESLNPLLLVLTKYARSFLIFQSAYL